MRYISTVKTHQVNVQCVQSSPVTGCHAETAITISYRYRHVPTLLSCCLSPHYHMVIISLSIRYHICIMSSSSRYHIAITAYAVNHHDQISQSSCYHTDFIPMLWYVSNRDHEMKNRYYIVIIKLSKSISYHRITSLSSCYRTVIITSSQNQQHIYRYHIISYNKYRDHIITHNYRYHTTSYRIMIVIISYLSGLDGLNLPRTRDELDGLRGVVGDLHLVHEDVLILKGVALLRVVLAAHLNPVPRQPKNGTQHAKYVSTCETKHKKAAKNRYTTRKICTYVWN